MKILNMLEISVDELAGKAFHEKLESLAALIEEHGVSAVRITDAVGSHFAFKDQAIFNLKRFGISII